MASVLPQSLRRRSVRSPQAERLRTESATSDGRPNLGVMRLWRKRRGKPLPADLIHLQPDDPRIDRIVALLDEIRERVAAAADDDFGYPVRWDSRAKALGQLESLRVQVAEGEVPSGALGLLVAPTAALQDLSIRGGWGGEFIELSGRVDNAIDACLR